MADMTSAEALEEIFEAFMFSAYSGYWRPKVTEALARLRALGFAIVPVEATDAMLMVDVRPSALILGSPNIPRVQQWRRQIWRAMVDAAMVADKPA